MTNFRLFQTEGVCRRQFQILRKWKRVIPKGWKHSGKRRNCLLQANSPFPTVFSKGLFPRGIKRCHCVGMVKQQKRSMRQIGRKHCAKQLKIQTKQQISPRSSVIWGSDKLPKYHRNTPFFCC